MPSIKNADRRYGVRQVKDNDEKATIANAIHADNPVLSPVECAVLSQSPWPYWLAAEDEETKKMIGCCVGVPLGDRLVALQSLLAARDRVETVGLDLVTNLSLLLADKKDLVFRSPASTSAPEVAEDPTSASSDAQNRRNSAGDEMTSMIARNLDLSPRKAEKLYSCCVLLLPLQDFTGNLTKHLKTAPETTLVVPYRSGMEQALVTFDGLLAGSNRDVILKAWTEPRDRTLVMVANHGSDQEVIGYGIIVGQGHRLHLGPLYADDEETAAKLASTLVTHAKLSMADLHLEQAEAEVVLAVPKDTKGYRMWTQKGHKIYAENDVYVTSYNAIKHDVSVSKVYALFSSNCLGYV